MSDSSAKKTEEEWKATLTPDQYHILREKGTDPAGHGKYDKHYPESGNYYCAGCGSHLYTAEQKFDSGCGWPAFYDNVEGAITRNTDVTHGMKRVEIVCTKCDGHLGHVFEGEKFPTPTDQRHCVNSTSITFK
eukprot:TRINITY_DN2654_c1_g1_i2.p1 TRINITY_DN2654_c1_g1~~TRINITY_DN2654_c1_g1_i2.p1  ORF type:complete len:133 (+),score=29.35 TRINITY_DN2654_c1_g1_i2:321-719(+)